MIVLSRHTVYSRLVFLGIGGTINYPRAKKIQRTLALLDESSFVLEADSLDMRLCSLQGSLHKPLSIPNIARCVAHIRLSSIEEMMLQTHKNFLSMFPKWYEDKR